MIQQLHGGDWESLAVPVQLDYSVNLNPLGMPPEIKQALQVHVDDYARYPDGQCRALRQALSGWEQTPAEWILCGNGAADLLLRICQAVQPGQTLVLAPTFSEYEKGARLVQSQIIYHRLRREEQFAVTERILEALTAQIDLCFLCNPNNPTGQLIEPALLHKILQRCAEQKIILVVDECFLDFTAGISCKQWLSAYPNLIVVKAFTKLFAMAGVRLGYLLSSNAALREKIAAWGQSWPVSAPAQYAGIAACGLRDFALQSRRQVAEERQWLTEQLRQLGLAVVPGTGNFICFRARRLLWQPLLERGILVRSCASYHGLDAYDYRICVKQRQDNQKLLQALREVCNG